MAGKNWGPFTGAQLTMMFLAVTALALPDRLLAVAASAVSVTDAANGHTAAVSSARRLFVSALNEEVPTPAAFFHPPATVDTTDACQSLGAPPSGKGAVITEVRINVWSNPSPGVGNSVTIYKDANCATILTDVNPPSVGQTIVPFNPGVPTKTGLYALTRGQVAAEFSVDGYLVPLAQVPAS